FRQFRCKLHALCLTSGQCSGMLTKGNITKTYFTKRLNLSQNLRLVFKIRYSFFYGHVKYIANGFTLETNFQSFAVVTFSLTSLTRNMNIGKEFHFNQTQSGTVAGFAPTAFHIK